MPLPYYIKREPTEKDKESYQTVFARVRRGGCGADGRVCISRSVCLRP